MLSWGVWNVCLGNVLQGVWKNNKAVNTKGRHRPVSLFQMWRRHPRTQHTATSVPLPVCQPGSCIRVRPAIVQGFECVRVCRQPCSPSHSQLLPNAHLSQTTEQGWRGRKGGGTMYDLDIWPANEDISIRSYMWHWAQVASYWHDL